MISPAGHLVDIGANLTHDSFAEDLDQVLIRAAANGVRQLIVTGASLTGSEQAARLAASRASLFATAGIHPHHADETTPATINELRRLAAGDKVKAIGETGLDFFRDLCPRPQQINAFEQHIELAAETGLPMFLHERDAHPTLAEVLGPARGTLSGAVVHCFTGNREALHAYLNLDCYIGITGWVCDERRGTHLLELIKDIPTDKLMLETDAPYLMPRTLRPRPKTRRNEPQYLVAVCEMVAGCLAMDYDSVARMTTANAHRFFGLPVPDD